MYAAIRLHGVLPCVGCILYTCDGVPYCSCRTQSLGKFKQVFNCLGYFPSCITRVFMTVFTRARYYIYPNPGEVYVEWCSMKERSGKVWLLAAVWQLKEVPRNREKVRCPLCLGEEDAKCILLDCWESRNWRFKFLNDKWLHMNKEVAYRKTLKCTSEHQTRNLGRYLDTVTCK